MKRGGADNALSAAHFRDVRIAAHYAVRAHIEPVLASHVTLIFEDPLMRPKLMQAFSEDQNACLHSRAQRR